MSAPVPGRAGPRTGFRPGAAPAVRWPGWHFAADAAALLLLLGLGILGLGPVFGFNMHYLTAGFGGILLGLALAALSARFRWNIMTTAAATFFSYVAVGSALAAPAEATAGMLPSLQSLSITVLGIVRCWKDILTIAAPVGITGGMLVVPALGGLVAALASGLLAWRVRKPYWALLPVVALFLLGILFGTSQSYLPLLRGVLLTGVALGWLSFRLERARRQGTTPIQADQPAAATAAAGAARLRRLGMGAAVLLTAAALTAAAGPLLTGGGARTVLRDVVEPPFDLQNYPSPLMDFRGDVKDKKDTVLFTAAGLPKDGRIRLAALDSYDGHVYSVSSAGGGNFAPVGDPGSLGGAPEAGGQRYQLRIGIKAYRGVWLPSGYRSRGFGFPGDAAAGAKGLYFNAEADTALDVNGLRQGSEYTVDVSAPAALADDQLAQYNFAPTQLPEPSGVPQVVAAKADDLVANATTPIERVRALERYLNKGGKFSNGLLGEGQVLSLSGHTAFRINQLLTGKEMVGDDEQYAVAMALMARHLGIPARVVMGFYPDPKSPANGAPMVEIKGKDVHAWVEVEFEKLGWVPFNPTPDKDNVPTPPDPLPKSKPKPQVLQPPPPPQEPAQLPQDSAPDALDADKQQQDLWALLGPILAAIGIGLIPVAVLAIPLLAIAFLKLKRRRRRLRNGPPAQRVGGGWNEILSLATDLGAVDGAGGTRRETAVVIGGAFPGSAGATTALARRADAAIFGAGQPSDTEVDAFWEAVDGSLKEMRGSVGFWRRQRARFSPRSLLRDAREGLSKRKVVPLTAPQLTAPPLPAPTEQDETPPWQHS